MEIKIKNKQKLREALKKQYDTTEQYKKIMNQFETSCKDYSYVSDLVMTILLKEILIKEKYQQILQIESGEKFKMTKNKTTFEKVMDFCYKNKIEAELGHIYKGKGHSLQIWTASNSYFWARINEKEDSRYSDILPRTVITDEVFDIEMYKPNGDAYQGSYSRRISHKELITQLKMHFLEEY